MVKNILTALAQSERLSRCRKIMIRNSSLMLDIALARKKNGKTEPHRRMPYMILLTTTFIACLFFIVYSTVFFINEVLLFDKPPVVTESGAIIPQRSCHREQVLFFFSSSERWANTGVHLSKGDRIKISTSGGFHSDVANLTASALLNRKPTYAYYTNEPIEQMDEVERRNIFEGTENCIYSVKSEDEEVSARFGSVLWTISDENTIHKSNFEDTHREHIYQVEPVRNAEKFIEIEESGEIFFSVNDIYLSDQVIRRMCNSIDNNTPEDGSLQSKTLLAKLHDSGKLFISQKCDGDDSKLEIISDQDRLIALFNEDYNSLFDEAPKQNLREMWFNDNIGNIMICVEIERSIGLMHGMSKWYRSIERIVDSMYHGWFSSKFGIICLTLLLCVSVILFSGLFVVLVYLIFHPKSLKALARPKETLTKVSGWLNIHRYATIYTLIIVSTIITLLITRANLDLSVMLLLCVILCGYIIIFPLRDYIANRER